MPWKGFPTMYGKSQLPIWQFKVEPTCSAACLKPKEFPSLETERLFLFSTHFRHRKECDILQILSNHLLLHINSLRKIFDWLKISFQLYLLHVEISFKYRFSCFRYMKIPGILNVLWIKKKNAYTGILKTRLFLLSLTYK